MLARNKYQRKEKGSSSVAIFWQSLFFLIVLHSSEHYPGFYKWNTAFFCFVRLRQYNEETSQLDSQQGTNTVQLADSQLTKSLVVDFFMFSYSSTKNNYHNKYTTSKTLAKLR